MSDPILKKDFYKLDVYRFDDECVLDDWYDVGISNTITISWDIFTLKGKKEELLGLADFIKRTLENEYGRDQS